MIGRWRILGVVLVLGAAMPEVPRYRAEQHLTEAGQHIDALMRGRIVGAEAVAAAQQAEGLAAMSAVSLPGDARPPLHRAVALMLLGRADEAASVLEQAIADGERPEFTLNLGRVRTMQGDAAAADRAYLRAAWASDAVLNTLPQAMRDDLTARVRERETSWRHGQTDAAPPW